MKRLFMALLIALVLFALGFGGGLFAGRTFLSSEEKSPSTKIEEPGPVFFVGDFISNLSGTGSHVVNFKLSLEMEGPKSMEMVSSPSWLARIKNEVILLTKDRVFEELTSAEGIMNLAEDIRRTLNSILPPMKEKPPVVRVLFEGFVLQ